MAAEAWTEIRVLVPTGWAELVAEQLALGPCTSVAFGAPSLGTEPPPEGHEIVRSYVAARDDTPELRRGIEARLGELAARTGCAELGGLAPRFHVLPAEDYAQSWKKVWRPFRVGRLCVVTDDFAGTLREDDLRLSFELRSSFGTGRHATTRMCLALLQERPLAGARVLDAGTGSGLLAVVAATLGAEEVLGFDIDPESKHQAEALAGRNGVADRCTFRRGGFETLEPGDTAFDAVLANLYSDLIQEHGAELARRLAPGGWFAFSGCPDRHAEATATAIRAAGLEIEETRSRGRWRTFTGRRPR